MPRRNLFILFVVAIVAVLCRYQIQDSPYMRVMAGAMATIENRASRSAIGNCSRAP